MTTEKNFLGIPVEGDINLSSSRIAQDSPELLQAKISELLKFPEFEAMRWRQYTPYFNDGDPCEFGVYEVYFKFSEMSEEYEDEEYGDYGDGFVGLGDGRYVADEEVRRILGVPAPYHSTEKWEQEPENLQLIEVASDVSRMIASGRHYDFLYESFGDHAIVTVRKDKILVDEYEHD